MKGFGRRKLVILIVAAAVGISISKELKAREARSLASAGPSVQVLIATKELKAGHKMGQQDMSQRTLPQQHAGQDAAVNEAALIGREIAVDVSSGDDLTNSMLRKTSTVNAKNGERVVNVTTVGNSRLVNVGDRVDVLVSSASEGLSGMKTRSVAEGAEVLNVSKLKDQFGSSEEQERLSIDLKVKKSVAVKLANAQASGAQIVVFQTGPGAAGS